jgi:hypothetical protein
MIAKFTPVPFAASNLSNDELVRLVEHSYPNLQGPLQALVSRVARTAGTPQERRPMPAHAHSCPHCGSAFALEDDSEWGLR